MRKITVFVYVFLFLTGVIFQNCSDVSFSNSSASAAGGMDIPDNIEGGLVGGHFDIDTSSQIYDFSRGDTDDHVHEYDDRYNVTYADFFNLLAKTLKEIDKLISLEDRFILIVANANLSPGAIVEINGQQILATTYQTNVTAYLNGNSAALKTYTLGNPTFAGDIKLNSLKIQFEPNAIINGGLLPTQTVCVVNNDPGKLGEYRNGALTIQAIDVDNATFNKSTGTASAGLLWEATLFWHKQGFGCYE